MILRSSCQLKKMILYGGQMTLSDNALLNILSITPHLRSLTLDTGLGYSAISTDELFKALIYRPGTSTSTTLIPQLRALKIDYIRLHPQNTQPKLPDPDIVSAMVTSRRNIQIPDSSISISSASNNHCTPLESFKLHLVHPPERMNDVIEWGDTIKPRLRALESEGLTLVLKTECRYT
ncbi:hypothetical protein K435DRAFT_157259 [Dendrothele bispora CBS 962.96]|uniref:Uncharacterized protein n=1 Tax=Dendrothele bispora (strain CBS 962.96) TaxID=1314807 RepID=A0A4V4HFD7_DENBC|nr:hypothetical protein K435DRAFT_157259 [Dendrothele bispora CBS 962.96]